MNEKKLINEMLYEKLEHEYISFLNELQQKDAEKIIEASYEKVFKEDLFLCLSQMDLSYKDASALYDIPYPLDALYREWLDSDITYMDRLGTCIESFVKTERERKDSKMVNIDEFRDKLIEELPNYLPERVLRGCSLVRQNVVKHNDKELRGIVFNYGENLPNPIFYVEDAYHDYMDGGRLESILADLSAAIVDYHDNNHIDSNEIISMNYEKMKEYLGFYVVEIESNYERLKECLYTEIGDTGLAMQYHISIPKYDGYIRAIITEDMLNSFVPEVTKEQVTNDAKLNMQNKSPAVLCPLKELMTSHILNQQPENYLNKEGEIPKDVFTLTNGEMCFGAAALFYDDMQKQIGDVFGENYYVLPSSVHEIMIVPESMKISTEDLLSMVKNANSTVTDDMDVLANAIFYYDRATDLLSKVEFDHEVQPAFEDIPNNVTPIFTPETKDFDFDK